MTERGNIKNLDGNVEAIRRYDNIIEERDITADKIESELDNLISEFMSNVNELIEKYGNEWKTHINDYIGSSL